MKQYLMCSGGKDKDTISEGFKFGRTFASVDREIELINSQMSIFDLL